MHRAAGTLAALAGNKAGSIRMSGKLYHATIERNPDCWLAYCNLGNALLLEMKTLGGNPCYEKALRLNPNLAAGHQGAGHARSMAWANCRERWSTGNDRGTETGWPGAV